MDFRTELSLKPAPWKININDPILTLGSCFAQSMGMKFLQNKFQATVNPFGTTYHPVSIHKLLNYVVFQETPSQHTYLENEGVFYNYDFHSKISAPTLQSVQKQINESIGSLHYIIKNCKILMLTYGTSWIYDRVDTGDSVANCHKLSAALFSKRLVAIDEIRNSFRHTYRQLKSVQPSLRVILTVSPVRHLKDTLTLNTVSKSMLRIACHQISQEHSDVDYFPAYEIMVDDLRDYRFYKDDLIHPTEAAEKYIWDKFRSTYFDTSTLSFLKQWNDILNALTHRPTYPESKVHQKFLRETLALLEELKSTANVDDELNLVRHQLK